MDKKTFALGQKAEKIVESLFRDLSYYLWSLSEIIQKMKKEEFIKVVPDKKRNWIADIYYGVKGYQQKGHIVSSGAYFIEGAYIKGDILTNWECEQPLYHRNSRGNVLIDTGIKR